MKQNESNFTRSIVTGSLLCSTTLVLILIFIGGSTDRLVVFLAGLVLITIILWFLIPYLDRKKIPFDWLLAIAVLNNIVVVPELALRLADFRYEPGIQFGFPQAKDFVHFDVDEKLFWKLKSSNPHVNSLGFPGPEISTPKPEGVFRILFLSDSCAILGYSTRHGNYPSMAELILSAQYATETKRIECLTLAVAGYSSHQGRVLAEMYGSKLEPDLVVVCFGWNDHWLAYGSVDAEKRVEKRMISDISDFVYTKLRILQAIRWLLVSVTGPDTPLNEVRVPLDQYRDNLHTIIKIFDRENVPVILVTAPTLHYQLPVPDYIITNRFAKDKKSVIKMHKEYNQVVRDMALADNTLILDLEKQFNSMSKKRLIKIFQFDGIHFTQVGKQVVAERLSDFIQAQAALQKFPNFPSRKAPRP